MILHNDKRVKKKNLYIHEEDMTIINIYATNNRNPKYMK